MGTEDSWWREGGKTSFYFVIKFIAHLTIYLALKPTEQRTSDIHSQQTHQSFGRGGRLLLGCPLINSQGIARDSLSLG